jgi:hypothetical protein
VAVVDRDGEDLRQQISVLVVHDVSDAGRVEVRRVWMPSSGVKSWTVIGSLSPCRQSSTPRLTPPSQCCAESEAAATATFARGASRKAHVRIVAFFEVKRNAHVRTQIWA